MVFHVELFFQATVKLGGESLREKGLPWDAGKRLQGHMWGFDTENLPKFHMSCFKKSNTYSYEHVNKDRCVPYINIYMCVLDITII